MVQNSKCPIETALEFIRNKWSIEIIRDLFMGKCRFNEFRKANPKLSGNVLSDRLKDLINKGIIAKNIDEDLQIKYQLTPRGQSLNKVLYELAVFACNGEVTEGSSSKMCSIKSMKYLKKVFNIK